MSKLNAIDHKLQELLALAHQLDGSTNSDMRQLRESIHAFVNACTLLVHRAKRRCGTKDLFESVRDDLP